MVHARTWFIAALALVTMFGSFGCKSDGQQRSGSQSTQPVTIHDRWSGSDQAFQQSGHWLINSQRELAATGTNQLTNLDVDWNNQSLIILAMGERNTGGYWATITGAQQKQGKLYFQAVASRPGQDTMTTQALTYPVAAAVVDKVQPRVVIPEIESVTGGNVEEYNTLRMDELSRWNAQTGR